MTDGIVGVDDHIDPDKTAGCRDETIKGRRGRLPLHNTNW